MAEAFFRSFDPNLRVFSAGTAPASHVSRRAIAVMKEIGFDLTGQYPKSVDQYLDQEFDYVVTVCDDARESCPVFTGKVRRRAHIGFRDPSLVSGTDDQVCETFRSVRDEMKERLRAWYEKELRGEKKTT
jgi:arsenate reductase